MFLCLVRQGERVSGGAAPSASVSKETLGVVWLSLCHSLGSGSRVPGLCLNHTGVLPSASGVSLVQTAPF